MFDINKCKVENNTCKGKCSGCGNCCTDFLPLSRKEYKRIKNYLKEHPDIKEQLHINDNTLHIKCAFRDDVNKKCLIYPVRPEICKEFLCNKSVDIITEIRNTIQSKSYYNKIDTSLLSMHNLVSTHSLFFENYTWELDFIYNVCDFDEYKIKVLLPHFYFKYEIEKQ